MAQTVHNLATKVRSSIKPYLIYELRVLRTICYYTQDIMCMSQLRREPVTLGNVLECSIH